jgi:uncharacterized repeat protein (TIGR01451 family)
VRLRVSRSPIGAGGAAVRPWSALSFTVRSAGLAGLVLTAVMTASAAPAAADTTTIGPVFPAPGSGTWTSTGTPTGGEIGKAGGITWSYTGVDPTQFDQMVWGLGYPTFPATFSFGLDTAALAFDPATSSLSGGVLNFTGSAEFPNLDGSTPSYPVRLQVTTATGPSAFVDPGSLTGLTVDPGAGGVLPVTGDFSVNLIIEVSTDGGTTWTPANDYFNNTPHTAGVSTSSSVQGDFWYTAAAPTVSFGQSPLAFGSQPIGSTTQLTEIVTNTGTGPLAITQIDAGGDYSAPSDTCVGKSIGAGDTCSINVDFTPSAGGTDNGSLVLTDNAPGSPQTLQLTGAGNQAQAVLSPNPVDFGTVSLGSSDQEVLTVSNPGTDTLDLTNAQLTGADPGDFQITGLTSGCTSPTVPAGGNCGLQITFTPGGAGTRSATLTVTDNASPPTQSVTLTGTGAQTAATVSPDNIDFGTVPVGNSGTVHAVTITSTGTAGLHVTGESLGGADPSDFDLVGGSCPAAPFTLAAGTSCTVDVYFAPTAVGSRSATLAVGDDAATSPQQILLGGNGSPSADVAVFLMPSSHKVAPGAAVTYSVVADNFGPTTAAKVIVTDALPPNASFVSSSGASCTTPPPGYTGKIVCSLGTMPASSSQAFTFVVKLHAKANTKVSDTVKAKAATYDPITANNTASTVVKVT